jgi:DNA (cytosine-5)-methyltransferase 1
MKNKLAGSLFSGGGIGDVGIEWGHGIPVLAASELVPSRAALIRKNFPGTKVFEGDIWKTKDAYVDFFKEKLGSKHPWLLTLSPPCQGMSSNGAGRISSQIKLGKRSKDDERNRLILPGIEILENLKPKWFILENVRRMENTVIRNEKNIPENILNWIKRRLEPLGYTIFANILDFRDYGVPHHRERLITVGCRIPGITSRYPPDADIFSKVLSPFHPPPTHGKDGVLSWVSLKDTIRHLPLLDAKTRTEDDKDEFHCIPRWNNNQYFWMSHTPEGKSAFDNMDCVKCNEKAEDALAVFCKCGEKLARPQIQEGNKARLVKGFKSSYRRMKWDKPGGTLTMNSGVISSDVKGHPDQNRVLSLREILILSTLDHPAWPQKYSFDGIDYGRGSTDKSFSSKLVREVIGESIPPLAMEKMVKHLLSLETNL